jgi:hypothetical protein
MVVAAIAALAALILAPHPLPAQTAPGVPPASARTEITGPPLRTTAYGRLPLAFEANLGQADSKVQFLARGLGYTLFLTGPNATLRLLQPNGQIEDTLQLRLVGARRAAARGEKKLDSVTNYYLGNDPHHWYTNVPNFAEVGYENVYPGVGLRYYGRQGALENDLVIAPGADPGQIRLAVKGAQSLRLDDDGNLVLALAPGAPKTAERRVVLTKPEIYQVVGGQRHAVRGGFVLLARAGGTGKEKPLREIGFTLGDYDRTQPLVIDPTLSYSYNASGGYSVLYGAMGASSGPTLNVDTAGEAVLVGLTSNAVLQTTGGPSQITCAAGTPSGSTVCNAQSIYIAKFNAAGTGLTFATYFGGSNYYGSPAGESAAFGALDPSGNIYVAGQTNAIDFPTAPPSGALQTTASPNYLCKFDSSGQLVYSTYLGQSDMTVYALAADAAGDAYVGGSAYTSYTDVPQINPLPLLCSSTCYEGFILGVNPQGSAYIYGTYVGGSNSEYEATVQTLATYSTGGNYLAFGAETSFPDMPLTTASYDHAVQTSGGGYVALLDLDGEGADEYMYATYLGGAGQGVTAVGLGPGTGSNILNLYVGGEEDPESPPYILPVTPGAFEPLPAFGFPVLGYFGPGDAYVASFSSDDAAQITTNYVSYLGGSYQEGTTINAIAGDSNGDTWVAGTNVSGDFPLLNPLPALGECSGTTYCHKTGFVTEINPDGTALLFSTFLGGNTDDVVSGLGLDSSGNVYASGWTESTNFPVTSGSPQSSCINPTYGTTSCIQTWFVTKLAPQPVPVGPNLTFTLNGTNGSALAVGGTITFPSTFESLTQYQVITVTNTAPSGPPLTVTTATTSSAYISSSLYYDFVAIPNLPGSQTGDQACMTSSLTSNPISPGASCDITVSWTPYVTGVPDSSVIEIFDNAANIFSPQYFNLNGTAVSGAGATLTPSLLSFANVLQGQQAVGSFTVASTGNQPLIFSTPAFTLAGSPHFSISSTTCGASLGLLAGSNYTPDSCTVSITYSAQGNGGALESAQLSVWDNSVLPASPSPQTAQVTATTLLPQPQLVLVPASVASGISFPATAQDLPSGTTSFRIENEGGAPLTTTSISVSGANGSDFHESDTCTSSSPLPVSASCTVSLYFQPTQQAPAQESSTLIIASNDPTNPNLPITLSGQSATPPGPPPSLPVPASVDNSVPPVQSTVPAGLPAISSGGQFVAFFAPAQSGTGLNSNLPNPPPSSNDGSGVYVRNTCAGPNAPANCTQSTQFVAYNPAGAACYFPPPGTPGANLTPAISSDGRFVAFNDYNCSSEGLTPIAYLFLRDTQGQTTQITDVGGTPLVGAFSMSASAEFFGFASNTEAVDRSPGDTSWQAYLNDTGVSYGKPVATPPATLLVSQDNNGNEDGSYNYNATPAVSPDGRFVAFASPWNDLSGGGLATGDDSTQVYLRDTCAGAPQSPPCTPKTILISSPDNLGTFGSGGGSGVAYPYGGMQFLGMAVSAGGRYVAFTSLATNLPSANNSLKIYLRDTCQTYAQPVSSCTGSGSGVANPGTTTVLLASATVSNSFAPQISSDGRIISFLSVGQLTANAPIPALYAYDTCLSNGQPVNSCTAGLLGVISQTTSGAAAAVGAALDGTGQFAAYTTGSPSSEVWLNGTAAPVAAPAPAVTLSTYSLDFGSVPEGTPSAVLTITLTNTGNANLVLGKVYTLGSDAADFSPGPDGCSGQTIAPNNTCTVGVTFTPSISGPETAALNFTDNASSSPQGVALSGTGTSGVTQVAVPNVVGDTEAAAAGAITAAGLTVGTVTIASSTTVAAGEVISENPGAGSFVNPGSAVSLTVSSGPPISETITVTDAITVTPLINVSAPVVEFSAGPTIGFNNQGGNQTLTVSDIGLAPLTLDSDTPLTGPGSAQFSVTLVSCSNLATSLPTTLPSGGACTFTIAYTPSGNTANDNATLIFTDNAGLSNLTTAGASPNYTQSITLSGSQSSSSPVPGPPPATVSVPASGPDNEQITVLDQITVTPLINVSAPVVEFSAGPTIGFNNQGGSQTLTVSDIGLAPLTLDSYTPLTGPGSAQFSVTLVSCSDLATSLPTTLPSGGACAFNITYTPSANPEYDNATLTFTDDASLSNLTPTGSNGTQSITLSGSGTSSTVPGAPPATIQVPTSGPDNETITVSDQVLVSATGPVVSLSPTSLSFPGQLDDSTSSPQTVTLTNTGNTNLNFTSISISAPFVLDTSETTCSLSTPVTAGSTCTVAVSFSPTTGGAQTGTLSFGDNAGTSPQTVSLSGSGETFLLSVATGSSLSATVSPGQTATYTLNLAGVGGLNQTVAAKRPRFGALPLDATQTQVSFTCTGAPSESTCTVSPNPATITSSGTTVTVSVTTTAPSAGLPRARPFPLSPPLLPLPTVWLLAVLGAALLGTLPGRGNRGASRHRPAFLALAAVLLLTLGIAACGGGGAPAPSPIPGTPAGTYTLTLTGTVTSGSASLQQSINLTLNVQ